MVHGAKGCWNFRRHLGAIHIKWSGFNEINKKQFNQVIMISNTVIFIFGAMVFGVWLIASFLEFRKMSKNPEDYGGGSIKNTTSTED